MNREVPTPSSDPERWSHWGSPVGLGLFFLLMAVAVDVIRFAFK